MGVTISVIVPAYNSRELLRHCLSAIAASDVVPLETIVVDDGSTDGSDEVARSFGVRVLYTGSSAAGPAVARNLGAAQAQGEILFFTDCDCGIHHDTLGRVQALFDQDGAPDAAIGSYDFQPGDSNFLSQYRNLLHAYVHQTASEDASTFWGGCGAIRRDIFLELRGFDTNRYKRPSIEDIELGYRLKTFGGRIHLDKQMMVTHFKRWTPANLVRTDVRDRGIPWMRLILQSGHMKADLNLKIRDRISVVLVYLMLLGFAGILLTPFSLLISLVAAFSMLVLHRDLYRYFASHQGIRFMVYCLPWHWLYYFFNGISFFVGIVLHLRDSLQGRLVPSATPGGVSALERSK